MNKSGLIALLAGLLMVPTLGAAPAAADPDVVFAQANCELRRPRTSFDTSDPQRRTTGGLWQKANPADEVEFIDATVGDVLGLDGFMVEVAVEGADVLTFDQTLTAEVNGVTRTFDAPVTADCRTLPTELASRSGQTRIDIFNWTCQPARPGADNQLGFIFQFKVDGYTPDRASGTVSGIDLTEFDAFGAVATFGTIFAAQETYELDGSVTATYLPDGGGAPLVETYDIDITARCPDFAGLVSFSDDNDSVFEADIEWLATEGITQGCNPPANTRFCPDDPVTRGQMAAFLVRALGYTDRGTVDFTDDNGSVFEADIERLATEGITFGCNPPANTRFCPDDPVTRGQMAAFLKRALDR
jgi:hypothetical protein